MSRHGFWERSVTSYPKTGPFPASSARDVSTDIFIPLAEGGPFGERSLTSYPGTRCLRAAPPAFEPDGEPASRARRGRQYMLSERKPAGCAAEGRRSRSRPGRHHDRLPLSGVEAKEEEEEQQQQAQREQRHRQATSRRIRGHRCQPAPDSAPSSSSPGRRWPVPPAPPPPTRRL